MEISLNNYQAFFLDYSEGNLSAEQSVHLFEFLEDHPHLRAELAEFESVHIPPEKIRSGMKDRLKKNIVPVGFVSEDNYEDIFIAEFENDLSQKEKSDLEEFIRKNPFLVKEKKLYGAAHLEADKLLVYSGKDELKKTLVIPLYGKVAAAFAIAASALLFIWFAYQDSGNRAVVHPTAERKQDSVKAIDKKPAEQFFPVATAENNHVLVKQRRRQVNSKKKTITALLASGDNLMKRYREKSSDLMPVTSNSAVTENTPSDSVQSTVAIQKTEPGILPADSFLLKPFEIRNEASQQAVKARSDNFMTPQQLFINTAKKYFLKQDESQVKVTTDSLTKWDLLEAGIKVGQKLFGSRLSMNKKFDESGAVAAIDISSERFEFSTPVR